MNPAKIASALLEAQYSYGCFMINVPPEISDFVIEWGRLNVSDDVLVIDEDDGKGRELDPHITVKYGITSESVPDAVYDIVHKTVPFPVFVGKVSLFKNDGFDVVKCDVESQGLRKLNAEITERAPCVNTYPTYIPHITVAYVEPGSCDHLNGKDIFAEAENRQFVAPGMVWKAAGEDGEGRAEEVLLFSRKKPTVVEAVVGPTERELDEIGAIIRDVQQQAHGDPELFAELANERLEPYRIKFQLHPEMAAAPGCLGMANDEGIFLRPPGSYQIALSPKNDYFKSIRSLLHHELVHLHQMARMRDPKEVANRALLYVAPHGRLDPNRYLQQKQEIMAHAASMINSWHRQGLSADQMMAKLRSGDWGFGAKYWQARRQFPEVFKRYMRYAVDYINKTVNESYETNEDTPFNHVSFPISDDQVARFLNKRRKETKKRTIM